MAGDDNGNRIIVIGHADGSSGAGLSNGLRDIAVGTGFPIRNPEQFVPDRLLKRRALEIDGEIKASA